MEVIIKIKKIKLTIFAPDPERKLSNGIEYDLDANDNGTIVDALSILDKKINSNIEDNIFPIYKGLIKSYLQLIWNAEENIIYEDCAINAYGPHKKFMALHDDINFNLYPNSEITIAVHAD
ncbi:MAG: hypothetical protein ACFFC3_13460 [Candidatus Odinarchaeota archaeon]